MPWETVLEYASPYAIVIVLIWLIWQLLNFIERLNNRLDDFRQTIDKSITALQISAEAKRALESQQTLLCRKIDELEEKIIRAQGTLDRIATLVERRNET